MENLLLNVWSKRNNQVLTLILSLSSELPPKPLASIPMGVVALPGVKTVERSKVGMLGTTAAAAALRRGSFVGMTLARELHVAEIAVQGAPLAVSKPKPFRTG